MTTPVLNGQTLAETLMEDTCTITRSGGEPVFDDTTGTYTTPAASTVYSGKCRVKPQAVLAHTTQAGERAVEIWPYVVSLPFSATGIKAGDDVTIDTSSDPDLVDQSMVVRKNVAGTHITARRLGCEDQET